MSCTKNLLYFSPQGSEHCRNLGTVRNIPSNQADFQPVTPCSKYFKTAPLPLETLVSLSLFHTCTSAFAPSTLRQDFLTKHPRPPPSTLIHFCHSLSQSWRHIRITWETFKKHAHYSKRLISDQRKRHFHMEMPPQPSTAWSSEP